MSNTNPVRAAADIVDRLMEQVAHWPHPQRQFPVEWFQGFLASETPAQHVDTVRDLILRQEAWEGRREYLLALLDACAFCASAARSKDHLAWPILLHAERHAGIALAVRVSHLEGIERKSVLAKEAKDAQVAINAGIRAHVVEAVARSETRAALSVARVIVKELSRKHGDLRKAMAHYGSSLKPVDSTLENTFAEYIREEIEEVLSHHSTGFEKMTPRQRYSKWVELLGLPG